MARKSRTMQALLVAGGGLRGPELTLAELAPGTRIYNGGDMANPSGFGVVTAAVTTGWGPQVDLLMDDGRVTRALPLVMFSAEYSGNGSTRFVTEAAYQRWNENRQAEAVARWKMLGGGAT